jgi:hypothetical protein
MKLPNAHLAVVEREKIVNYLLDPLHPNAADKAEFFALFGFSAESWTDFAASLVRHGLENDVSRARLTLFGLRYQVDGPLVTPIGIKPRVRTVWQIDEEGVAPRLITAHPLEVLR